MHKGASPRHDITKRNPSSVPGFGSGGVTMHDHHNPKMKHHASNGHGYPATTGHTQHKDDHGEKVSHHHYGK